jgi:glutamate-ammonia-ligase adenylyltransferase
MGTATWSQLEALCRYSAEPEASALALRRLLERHPDALDRLVEGGEPTATAHALVAVAAASDALGRFVASRPEALDVLDALDASSWPIPIRSSDPERIALAYRLGLLWVAARDLTARADLEHTCRALSALADELLEAALEVALRTPGSPSGPSASSDAPAQAQARAQRDACVQLEGEAPDAPAMPEPRAATERLPSPRARKTDRREPKLAFAVVAMGKLGSFELNYSSDLDVLFVASEPNDAVARRLLDVARRAVRVDAALRPEGRAGALVRTLESYEAYWARWARPWERQALIKARRSAGDPDLGARFEHAAHRVAFDHPYGAEELAELRSLKARAERHAGRLGALEIKRSPGGIRDVEFSVQLLQLVHARHDPALRVASTLDALAELARGGYVAVEDAEALAEAYRFLRTVEHRLQLVEQRQVHAVPEEPKALARLARVLGFADRPEATATEQFLDRLRQVRATTRRIHERLFFRPLLEAFARPTSPTEASAHDRRGRAGPTHASKTDGPLRRSPARALDAMQRASGLSAEALEARLEAFGFADAARTRAHLRQLASGLGRTSRLFAQMLPLVLEWLSEAPDPDLGLTEMRNLLASAHARAVLLPAFRDSPEVARRACLVLGTSRWLAEALRRRPELLARLGEPLGAAAWPLGAMAAAKDDRAHAHADEGTSTVLRKPASVAPTSPAGAGAGPSSPLGTPSEAPWIASTTRLADEAEQLVRLANDLDAARARLRLLRDERLLAVAVADLLGALDVAGVGRSLTALAEALLHGALVALGAPRGVAIVGMGRLAGRELAYGSDLDIMLVTDDAVGDSQRDELARGFMAVVEGPSPPERLVRLDLKLRPEGRQGPLARSLASWRAYLDRWAEPWERQALLRARAVAGDMAVGRAFEELVASFVFDRPVGEDEERAIRRIKARVERERIRPREDPAFHLKLGPGALADVEWTVQLLQLRHRVAEPNTLGALHMLEQHGAITPTDAAILEAAYTFAGHVRNRLHLVEGLPAGAPPVDSLPPQGPRLAVLARSLSTTPTELRETYRRVTRRARRVVERLFYGMP